MPDARCITPLSMKGAGKNSGSISSNDAGVGASFGARGGAAEQGVREGSRNIGSSERGSMPTRVSSQECARSLGARGACSGTVVLLRTRESVMTIWSGLGEARSERVVNEVACRNELRRTGWSGSSSGAAIWHIEVVRRIGGVRPRVLSNVVAFECPARGRERSLELSRSRNSADYYGEYTLSPTARVVLADSTPGGNLPLCPHSPHFGADYGERSRTSSAADRSFFLKNALA